MATKKNNRPLGQNQIDWLVSTHEHQGHWKDVWYSGIGRVWSTDLATRRLCDSLVKRGLMQTFVKSGRVEYRMTKAGIAVAEQFRAERDAINARQRAEREARGE